MPARAQDAAQRIVVKLRDGSDATLERGDLVALRTDLAPLRRALAERGVSSGRFARTFSRNPDALRAERSRAERRSGRQLSDLALYFTLDVPAGIDPATLAASLRSLPLVESAERWPVLAPLPVDIDPPTPDFTALQAYTAAAPAGIGSAAFAGVAGADGAGTRYVDVEFSWQLAHEDLELPASALIPIGTPLDPYMDLGDHGNSVLGILSARPNGYGVTGLVPAAEVWVAPSSTIQFGWDVGRAIDQAVVALDPAGPGDVILIEQTAYTCGYESGTGTQLGSGPVEEFPAWRDRIAIATGLGVTVVEAAGNGSLDLDAPACQNAFNRALYDSGAIFVAAGSAATHAPLSYSNYGSRVDVQGVAEAIPTLGGGALFGGSDVLQNYQSNFGGSSGGSAMVAGMVLAIQGMRMANGAQPLEPLAMRDLLVETGTPQAPVPEHIGPLPDLAAAHAAGVPPPPIVALPPAGALALGALLLAVVALRTGRVGRRAS